MLSAKSITKEMLLLQCFSHEIHYFFPVESLGGFGVGDPIRPRLGSSVIALRLEQISRSGSPF